MDRFILRYVLIKFIRVFDRAVFHAGSATRAFILQNISGLFCKRYLEVPYFSLYTVNFSIGENFYVRMPADLDQLGCEYSHGAVIGREGLVELGHVAADRRRLLNQIDLEACIGKIEGGLNTADASADNHDIADVMVSKVLT